jgi:hypothetical protein
MFPQRVEFGLQIHTEVILKWWSESESANPGSQTGMYFGVYAALGVAAISSVFVALW